MSSTKAAPLGRPRSEEARIAVLHAVDDLLVEQGYEAMTMKGIAERAGVGRQTVYRWWSTKAEILFEACVYDARLELAHAGDDGLDAFHARLLSFLCEADAGASYLALIAAARLDPSVAKLMKASDPVQHAAEEALQGAGLLADEASVAQLVGPAVFLALRRL